MKTHELKTWPQFFRDVWEGRKRFEIRKNDRGFKVGDTLVLRDYDPTSCGYSGRWIEADIVYADETLVGLWPGFIALGIVVNYKREN